MFRFELVFDVSDTAHCLLFRQHCSTYLLTNKRFFLNYTNIQQYETKLRWVFTPHFYSYGHAFPLDILRLSVTEAKKNVFFNRLLSDHLFVHNFQFICIKIHLSLHPKCVKFFNDKSWLQVHCDQIVDNYLKL